jgi:hypothetical protein
VVPTVVVVPEMAWVRNASSLNADTARLSGSEKVLLPSVETATKGWYARRLLESNRRLGKAVFQPTYTTSALPLRRSTSTQAMGPFDSTASPSLPRAWRTNVVSQLRPKSSERPRRTLTLPRLHPPSDVSHPLRAWYRVPSRPNATGLL